MKIIKEGKWSNVWSKEYPCKECQAVLLVSEEDLKHQDNEHDSNFFNCPVCNVVNYVSKSDLSTRVREELNKKRQYWRD